MMYEVTIGDATHKVELVRSGESWKAKLDGREVPLDVVATQSGVFSILVNGRSYEIKQEVSPAGVNIVVGNQRFPASVSDPRSYRSRRRAAAGGEGPKKVTAPMPGKVVRILAAAGTEVEAGQGVIVIEAMKMQNELKSPKKGTVKQVIVTEGAAVDAGQVLAEIE